MDEDSLPDHIARLLTPSAAELQALHTRALSLCSQAANAALSLDFSLARSRLLLAADLLPSNHAILLNLARLHYHLDNHLDAFLAATSLLSSISSPSTSTSTPTPLPPSLLVLSARRLRIHAALKLDSISELLVALNDANTLSSLDHSHLLLLFNHKPNKNGKESTTNISIYILMIKILMVKLKKLMMMM